MKGTELLTGLHARFLTGVVLTLALLVWTFRDVSTTTVYTVLQGVQPGWLGLSLVFFLATFPLRAHRWGILLGAHCETGTFGIRHSAISIGLAVNCVFPFRAGEIARASILARFSQVSFGTAFGSIIAERVLDVLTVCLFLLAPAVAGTVSHVSTISSLYLSGIGVALLVACSVVTFAAWRPQATAKFAGEMCRRLGLGHVQSRIESGVGTLLRGLEFLRDPMRCLNAWIETLGFWLLIALTYWTCMLALSLTSPGIGGACFSVGVTALGIAIPSMPGYFGPFEAAVRFALETYALSADAIVAYALTLHLLLYVVQTALGLLLAAVLHLSWADLIPYSALRKRATL